MGMTANQSTLNQAADMSAGALQDAITAYSNAASAANAAATALNNAKTALDTAWSDFRSKDGSFVAAFVAPAGYTPPA